MASLKKLLVFATAIASSVYTFYVIGHFMFFLSIPKKLNIFYDTQWIVNLMDNWSRLETALAPLVTDYLLIVLFVLQHTALKSTAAKNITKKIGLETAHRTLYCLTSSLCLHLMVRYWQPAQSTVVWKVDAQQPLAWWAFVSVHALAWLLIYGGCIVMDLSDLLGVRQAYYDLRGIAPPSAYKSYELRHLYENVRHPSILGFTVILWCTNLMTLDRLILAIVLTAYMAIFWATDEKNVAYQQSQYKRKMRSLKSQ